MTRTIKFGFIEFMIGKRLSTIVFLIAVAVLASAQTTKSMNKDNKEKIPLYSYSKRKYTNAKLKKILAKINAIPREKLDFSTS